MGRNAVLISTMILNQNVKNDFFFSLHTQKNGNQIAETWKTEEQRMCTRVCLSLHLPKYLDHNTAQDICLDAGGMEDREQPAKDFNVLWQSYTKYVLVR